MRKITSVFSIILPVVGTMIAMGIMIYLLFHLGELRERYHYISYQSLEPLKLQLDYELHK